MRWLLQKRDVIPIIGVRRCSQFGENLGCLDFVLPDDVMKHLDEISDIEPGFPHQLIKTENVQNLLYGVNKLK